MSSRVRPDGAAALLAGGPVRARRARREVVAGDSLSAKVNSPPTCGR